ncbi:MAG: hypothetical protein V1824_01035 [archaeon]
MNFKDFQKLISVISIVLIIIVIATINVSAISLFSAQEVAKDYSFSNEGIDPSSYYISCNNKTYYAIPILNSAADISLFVPVSLTDGNISIAKISETKDQIKTAFVLRSIKTSSENNYLSTQLTGKIDRLNTILKSKKALLNGIKDSADYPINVKSKVNTSIDKLELLITDLDLLYTNLKDTISLQQSFLEETSCNKTDSLLYKLSNSIPSENNLTKLSLDYTDSINDITKEIVSAKELDDSAKRIAIDYITPPTNLNSEINTISESLSSTSIFYSKIISDVINTDNKINTFYDNLVSRSDYVSVNKMLYSYDSSFKDYDNLDSVIQFIFNENNLTYWKETILVSELNQNYIEIKDLISKTKYSKALPKIALAKDQAKKIIASGYQEIEYTTNNIYFYILAGLVIILVIAIILKNKKKIFGHEDNDPSNSASNLGQNNNSRRNNNEDLFDIKDPF